MRGAFRPHPELEELAALVDGQPEGQERERLVEHLAACAECRSLFAETAVLIGEVNTSRSDELAARGAPGGRLILGRWPKRMVLAAAIAASLALVAVAPRIFELVQVHRDGPVTSLADRLMEAESGGPLGEELAASWQTHQWPRARSAGSPASISRKHRSFQLGVRAMELEIALRSRQAELAQRLTYRLESLLADDPRLERVIRLYSSEQGVRGGLAAGVDPRTLTTVTQYAAEILSGDDGANVSAAIDSTSFELGLWARATQLALESGRAGYLNTPAHRRHLERLADEPLAPEVAAPVARLAALLADEPADHLSEIDVMVTKVITAAGGGTPSPTP